MKSLHRKHKKTHDIPGDAHYVTFSCQKRLPLLNQDRSRQWMVDTMGHARTDLGFAIWAYVIMPEHVHVLFWPKFTALGHHDPNRSACPESVRQAGSTTALRSGRLATNQMKYILGAMKRPVSVSARAYLIETNQQHWLQRLTVRKGNRKLFRFWLPGGGYDQNVRDWQAIEEIIDYIHANPVRRGLVERPTDWYWSSAQFYAGIRPVPLEMDPLPLF